MTDRTIRVAPAPACYLCGGRGEVVFANLRDRLYGVPGRWSTRRCSSCRLLWLDPLPVPEDIPRLYERYFTHDAGMEVRQGLGLIHLVLLGAYGYRTREADGLGRRFLGRILSTSRTLRDAAGRWVMFLPAAARGRLLDVGCGDGRFLARMQTFGWSVTGVEPDPEGARRAGERTGTKILVSTLEDAGLPGAWFDAITLSHVIEHVHDPVALLRECGRLLRPGGRIVVLTPNAESLVMRTFGPHAFHLDPPRHLFLFSPSTLRRVGELAGLRIERLHTIGDFARIGAPLSRAIRARGSLPGVPSHLTAAQRLEGMAFLVRETLAGGRRGRGEEVLLLATT